ncbi:MAG: hypothetical protein SVY10_16170, partial [Thermodesulfobacteriota bacterium]|nr:hypothetical protein [Thermodesulfobacteriota bacterium]
LEPTILHSQQPFRASPDERWIGLNAALNSGSGSDRKNMAVGVAIAQGGIIPPLLMGLHQFDKKRLVS